MFGLAPTHLFVATLFVGLLGLAVLTDAQSLRIPNRICIALALLYPIYVVASPVPVDWLRAVAIAVAVFVVGLIPFATGMMGGGDVKLLATVALWAGPVATIDFLLLTALFGGLLALVMVTSLRFTVAGALERIAGADLRNVVLGRSIPYGVAIAAGAYLTIAPIVLSG